VGKTTLARAYLTPESPNYFDLENPPDLERLAEPMAALAPLRGLVVIDEIQRRPELFPVLRVLMDRNPLIARFLILGSASPALLQQSSESLAGRLEMIDTPGFALSEVGAAQLETLWTRGGFPRSFLARSDIDSLAWRESFLRLTVERDLPGLGLGAPPAIVRRFWSMVAHYHGQIWSSAEPARSLGLSEPTVRRYLDFLTATDLVRQLQPWFENLGKRQIKSPKVYVRDSGLLHALFNLAQLETLLAHPKAGASWEGFLLEEVLKAARPEEAYFWGTHQGAELDLLMLKGTRRVGVEFKRSDAPALTPSMRIAMTDLKLDSLLVLYPGPKRYSLADRVEVLPATAVGDFIN
jgi:predicted AAA+ superfamily ATPase